MQARRSWRIRTPTHGSASGRPRKRPSADGFFPRTSRSSRKFNEQARILTSNSPRPGWGGGSSSTSSRFSRPPGALTLTSLTSRSSVPVADPDVVRAGLAFPGLHQRLQTHQENRPLGAAVVHELRWLLPVLVLEEDDGEVAFLPEVETDLRSDPFRGPLDHLPEDALAGLELEHLHVEAAELLAVGGKAELE